MKTIKTACVLAGLFSLPALAAVPSKTSITVEAEISTSIQVYVEGTDVTGGNISVKLAEDKGYMVGETPPFFFIGNANSVDVSLEAPRGGLISIENPANTMPIIVNWTRPEGGSVSAGSPLYNQAVYSSLAAIPDPQKGIRVNFRSTGKAETYELGHYSGTYIMTVKPNT